MAKQQSPNFESQYVPVVKDTYLEADVLKISTQLGSISFEPDHGVVNIQNGRLLTTLVDNSATLLSGISPGSSSSPLDIYQSDPINAVTINDFSTTVKISESLNIETSA